MSAPLVPFAECVLYTEFTPLVGSAEQSLPEIVQYEVYEEERILYFRVVFLRYRFWNLFGITGR